MGTNILQRNPEHPAPLQGAHTAPARARVFMFPGQSSAGPDVLSRARQAHPAAEQVADLARSVLGEARASEYLDAALRLVDERGRCYDEAPHGIMATVLAVDYETVSAVVSRARAYGAVAISNINAPTQHVIAGAEPAVAWAATTLEDEHAAHITVIERRVPMHSPLMAGVASAFAPALSRAPWRAAAADYVPNVTATPIAAPTADDFVTHLTRHVTEPVLWQPSIGAVLSARPDAMFIEVGPGGVLHNMMARAWRGARRARVDAPEGIAPRDHFVAIVEALRA